MRSTAFIGKTDVHEFIARQPRFSNRESALRALAGRKKTGGGLGKRLGSPLHESTANIASGEVKESRAISEIGNVGRELGSFAKAVGLSRVAIGMAGQYIPESGELRLEAEGALAAAILGKFFARRLEKAAPAIHAMLKNEALPAGLEPEDVAAAAFAIHMCSKGIDAVFRDLELGEKLKAGLEASGRGQLVEDAQQELLMLHLEFAKVLYLGSKAKRE
jgi:hypothetical protein